MRRNLCCLMGLSISLFFAGLASTASAQTTTPVKESPHAELIKTLRHAHRLLVHANHDYQGHRAKAAEEVHKALRELGFHPPKAQPASTPANGNVVPPQAAPAAHTGQPKMYELQANSDDQMREAKLHLEKAFKHLTRTGKHPKATANVQTAIAEVDMALGIK